MRTRMGLVLLLLLPGAALASSIDITETLAYVDCDAAMAPFFPYTYYVIARLYDDAASGGITGAEFRVDGHPADWSTNVAANTAAQVAIGNPLAGGCIIAFASCQGTVAEPVLLYTISGVALSPVTDRVLRVSYNGTPGPGFPCAQLVLCDEPVYTKVCVSGGTYCINTQTSCCILDTGETSWSQVKAMFR